MNALRPSNLILLCAMCFAGCDRPAESTVEFPRKPIKVIVPFAAGGGSDTFARIIQSDFESSQRMPEKLVIVNVPGGRGTIGSRRVKNAPADAYTILLLHEGILTAKYSGEAEYGPEAFAPIAGSGDASLVIAVDDKSPLKDLNDLMAQAVDKPGELIFAANSGAPSHFAGMMLEREKPGSEFRFASFGGGNERFPALQGGHADVSAFSIAEYMQFQPAGMRALAILNEQRHPEVPDLPTAKEQGFSVVSQNMQFWWAPKGTDPERIEAIADAINESMQSPSVQEQLAALKIDPVFLSGDELNREVQRREKRIASVSQRSKQSLPDFPLIILVVVALLGAVVLWERKQSSKETSAPLEAIAGVKIAGIIVAYAIAFSITAIGFRISTIAFVLACGLILKPSGDKTPAPTLFYPCLIAIAVLLGVGVHFVFTEIFVVDLP